jgi:hypothetical protein
VRWRALVNSVARNVVRDGRLLGNDEFFGHGVVGLACAVSTNIDLPRAASGSMISANQTAKQGDTAPRRDKVQGNSDLIARCKLNA